MRNQAEATCGMSRDAGGTAWSRNGRISRSDARAISMSGINTVSIYVP